MDIYRRSLLACLRICRIIEITNYLFYSITSCIFFVHLLYVIYARIVMYNIRILIAIWST